jgi:predicted ArsR family transcriptional regulator
MTTALTDRQQEVLALLAENGPMKVAEIAKSIGVETTSMRETLMSLNGRGLVRRRRDGGQVYWERRA